MPAIPNFTRETLQQMFVQVDSDPLAGKGCLTKRDILIDKIIAHVRVAAVTPAPVTPQPILADMEDKK